MLKPLIAILILAGAVHADALPAGVRDAVAKSFAGYRVAGPADYPVASTAAPATATPWAARGDFDGNGTPDVAVVLVGASEWQIAMFRQDAHGAWTGTALAEFPDADAAFKKRVPVSGLALETLAKGDAVTFFGVAMASSVQERDSLVVRLPASENQLLQYRWSEIRGRFATDVVRR